MVISISMDISNKFLLPNVIYKSWIQERTSAIYKRASEMAMDTITTPTECQVTEKMQKKGIVDSRKKPNSA